MLTDYVKPEQTFIVCPNQDVTYGAGFTELDKEPTVIQVPDFGDRFYVFALGERVLSLPDGSPVTRDRVSNAVRGAQRIAGIEQGVHILRLSSVPPLRATRLSVPACTSSPSISNWGVRAGALSEAVSQGLRKMGALE